MERENRELPEKILWIGGRTPQCIGVRESWDRCGGPMPYHDSYTFSMYTREDHSEIFKITCEAACQKLDAKIEEFLVANPCWRAPNILRRLFG